MYIEWMDRNSPGYVSRLCSRTRCMMLEEGTRSDFLVASCPPPPSCTDDSDASSSSRSPVPRPADLEILTHHSNLPLLPLRDPAFLLSPPSSSNQAKMSTTTTPEHAASSTLSKTKSNLRYLVNPASGSAPNSLVTRSSLKTFRYVLKFAFYRIMRYAVSPPLLPSRVATLGNSRSTSVSRDLSQKYAIVAAGATALGGTLIGTALPWVGAIVFPSLPVAAAMGATTALIKVSHLFSFPLLSPIN